MTVSRWAFAVVAGPVSVSLGFAAATVSFTAWNIMVPLLLNGFRLSAPVALLISVLLDIFNSATLTLLYGYHGKVDWWYGIYFGSASAGTAAIVSNILSDVVEGNQSALSGMMFVFPFLLSIGFFFKGAVVWRRRRKQRAAQTQAEYEIAPSAAHEPPTDAHTATTIEDSTSFVSARSETTTAELISMETLKPTPKSALWQSNSPMSTPPSSDEVEPDQDDHVDLSSSRARSPHSAEELYIGDGWKPKTSPLKKLSALTMTRLHSTASLITPITDVVHVPPMEAQHAPLLAQSFTNPIEANPQELPDADEYAARSRSMYDSLWRRFKVDKTILSGDLSNYSLRITLMAVFSIIMGALSGSLFIGGGMMFALATASIFRTNVRLATGTGSFICCMTMIAASFSFITDDELTESPDDSLSVISDLAYYILICVPCGIIGAIAGVRLSMRISDTAIFFFISAVLFALGVFISVQSKINQSIQN